MSSLTLPLFTSLINIVFCYDPVGYLLFNDTREPLVEIAAQVLCIALDTHAITSTDDADANSFINYLTRIHRDEVRRFLIPCQSARQSLLHG